jgi:hypothetical protein
VELLSNGFAKFRIMLESQDETNITNRDITVKMMNLIENCFKKISDKLRRLYFESSQYWIQPVSYYVETMSTCKILDNSF